MVRVVGETRLIRAVHPAPVGEGVIRWAQAKIVRGAPRLNARVYDHLAVASHVARYIPVTRPPVVLPAPSDVH